MYSNQSLARYIFVGIINTIIGYLVIFSFMFGGINPEFSNFLGYIIVIIVSYFLNKSYTFKSQNSHSKELPKFLFSMSFAYVLNLLTLMVCYRFFEINVYVSQILAGGVYTMSGYILSKIWVFKKESQNATN